ncbi:aminotransferase class III-fold pyridoxal phosphate-dependent enzyme [Bacillus mangrovi]|uniref:Aminotransferase class III-fold pyridoxal phosphate-dependent enzyme n=1 Tax=Metabacillus mangrovi TaxID=1491830 RepID=A0A7X2SA22_9BACI|nr:aspartate aminotransferase family protein [Metabacillus mangrovi]MTH55326.1 aminotransferase class III-fold pyridoxal phosphate-dependent enzyme [Metabacillus mangrovi]
MNSEVLYRELSELDKKHFLHPTTSIKQQQENGPDFIFTHGKGVRLFDLKGRSAIDGLSSLWNVNIGHGREEMARTAYEQMKTLAYSSCFATYSHEPAIRLAAKLADIAPGNLSAVFFTSGGSESNDTAYKLARHYWILKGEPERKKIISRTKSYHGVALGATSATGLKPFRDFTGSLAPDFCYVDHFSPADLRNKIEEEGPETVAAFIAEPVQGAGGLHLGPEGYFKEIRSICDEYGILLITDEVITAFGRTGSYFGIDHYSVEPDMMCFAKGITSGYAQLGGVMLTEELHRVFIDRSEGTLLHGYTYSGHPMACTVALKNLEIVESEGLIENARKMGEEMLKGFRSIEAESGIAANARALGLMGALEFVKNKETNERFQSPLAPKVVAEAAKRGLICRSVVFDQQDTLVFAPPLIMSREEMSELHSILEDAVKAVEKTIAPAAN